MLWSASALSAFRNQHILQKRLTKRPMYVEKDLYADSQWRGRGKEVQARQGRFCKEIIVFSNHKQKVTYIPDSSPPSSVLRRFGKPFKFVKRDIHTSKETHIQVQVITRDTCSAIRSRAIFGVATISRLLKMIGLFCRISSLL